MVNQAQENDQDSGEVTESEVTEAGEAIDALIDAMTTVKTVLKDGGLTGVFPVLLSKVKTFYISHRGEDFALDLTAIPVDSIEKALTYGLTQFVADGAAVDVHERDDDGEFVKDDKGNKVKRAKADVDKDKAKGIQARLDALTSGEFKTGGGGKTLSAFDVELRALVKNVLVKKGVKLADAVKLSKKPRAAIEGLSTKKADETVKAVKADADDAAKERRAKAVKAETVKLFDSNWKVLTDVAAKLAAEHKEMETTL